MHEGERDRYNVVSKVQKKIQFKKILTQDDSIMQESAIIDSAKSNQIMTEIPPERAFHMQQMKGTILCNVCYMFGSNKLSL